MDMSKMKTGLYYAGLFAQWNDFSIQGSRYLTDEHDWITSQEKIDLLWKTAEEDIEDNILACPEEYLK